MLVDNVAKRVGRTLQGVSARRRALGLPRFGKPFRPWTRAEDALLGTIPDKQLVRRLKRSYGAIAARRQMLRILPCRPQAWRPEDDKILGTRPDEQIALLLGRTKIAVRARRCELGIPNRAGRMRQLWNAEQEKLLGVLPDAEVARQLGRTLTSVKLHRLRRKK
jgi:hypothetical protein